MPVLSASLQQQTLQDAHLTGIGAQRKQSIPTDATDAEIFRNAWLRCASQFNDRQMLARPQ
jgi:hypothetical protein